MKKEFEISPGDKLISKHEIITIGGSIILEKGQEVTVREVLTRPGYWSNLCPDIYVPEKISAIRLVDIYGDWQLSTFLTLPHETH